MKKKEINKMKWTNEQITKLKALANAGTPNKVITAELGVPVTDVYAKRSQLGITIDKIQASKQEELK
jgi:hypothetical protein